MIGNLYTIAEIARLHGVTQRRADWAARQAKVEPVGRVGIIRVYDTKAASQIAEAIKRISARH